MEGVDASISGLRDKIKGATQFECGRNTMQDLSTTPSIAAEICLFSVREQVSGNRVEKRDNKNKALAYDRRWS